MNFKRFLPVMMAALASSLCSCQAEGGVPEIKVDSITLTSSAYEIYLDETATLTVDISPTNATNKNYVFSLNPSSLGTVENNIFTPSYSGTVEITAISDSGLKSSINILIKERKIVEEYDDKDTIINSLSSSTYSSSLKVEPSTLGIENGNIGVDKDKLENEELYPVDFNSGKVYYASDYNISPTGTNNSGNLINLIESIKDVEGNKIISFENATYSFSNTITVPAIENLYLVGKKDTKFVYSGWMTYIKGSGCKNLHINSIKFDMDPSPTITGQIIGVSETDTSATIEVKVNDEFDISNPRYTQWNNNKTSSYAEYYYDDEFKSYVPNRAGNLYYNPGVTNLSPSTNNILFVTLSKSFPYCSYKTPDIGTIVAVGFTVYEYFGFSFSNCDDTYIEDVTTYVAAGMGIRFDKGKNANLNRMNFIREPSTSRLLTCTADIIHTCALEGQLNISNCIIEGSHDDGLNIKSFYTSINSTVGNVATVSQTQSEVVIDFEAGDIVEVYDPTTIGFKDQYTVKEVVKNGSTFDLTLDKSLPRGDRSYVGYLLGNVTKATHLRLTNSVIKNKRNRGILLQGRDSIIENCTFENVNMGAVQVLGVADVFKEAIVPQNVVIKNTKFLKCWDDISVFTYGSKGSEQGSLKNVEIYNNFFYRDTGNTVYLRGSGDIKVRNNLFYETSNKNYSVYVRDSKNVDVYDNYTLFDKVNNGYKILHTGSNNDEDTITQNNNNLGGR